MVELETVSELAESIADMVGVYGCWTETDDHPDDCKCRMCFVSEMENRIREAVKNESTLYPVLDDKAFAQLMNRIRKLEEVHGQQTMVNQNRR